MQNCFFNESNDTLHAFTELFDFLWPAYIGVANLRRDYFNQIRHKPNITREDLNKVLCGDLGLDNYRKKDFDFDYMFNHTSFDMQKNELALLWINSAIALYEGWLKNISYHIFASDNNKRKTLEDCLQFEHKWIADFAALINGTTSSFMDSNFTSKYLAKHHRDAASVENLIKCFRVYKEYRNCYMHNGRKASIYLINAYNAYHPVANRQGLSVKKIPVFTQPQLNQPISLDFDKAILIGDIIMRLIVTVDALLVKTNAAEEEFKQRFKASSHYDKCLSPNIDKARSTVNSYIQGLRMPSPNNIDDVIDFILNNRLMSR